MQNSLSKFHNLSFQSSRFGFYHFSPLNFIFSQLISLFTTRYLLPLFFLVTLLSLFTYSSFSKKKKKPFHLQLLYQLGSMSKPKPGPISIQQPKLGSMSSPSFHPSISLLPLSPSRSLFLFLSPLFLPLSLSVSGGD